MRKELSYKTIVFTSIAVTLAIFVGLFMYGLIYVWYRNTGFREQNYPAFKAQESKNPEMPDQIISTTGKNPPVDTRVLARQLRNPIPATSESLSEGRDLYRIYCAPCHGASGDGKGIMGAVPALAFVPKDREDRLSQYLTSYLKSSPEIDANYFQRLSEGDIFFTITNGGEYIMPGFKGALSPEQRWNVVNLIRTGL